MHLLLSFLPSFLTQSAELLRVCVGEVQRLAGEDVARITSLDEEGVASSQQLPLERVGMDRSGHDWNDGADGVQNTHGLSKIFPLFFFLTHADAMEPTTTSLCAFKNINIPQSTNITYLYTLTLQCFELLVLPIFYVELCVKSYETTFEGRHNLSPY
jgi:hypothetical protein